MNQPKTYEEISLKNPNRMIYVFHSDGKTGFDDDWFCGTVSDCDNCFGLRIDANEADVISFASSQKATVSKYLNGILIEKIEPNGAISFKNYPIT